MDISNLLPVLYLLFKEEELGYLLENLATDFSGKCKEFAPKAFDNMVFI